MRTTPPPINKSEDAGARAAKTEDRGARIDVEQFLAGIRRHRFWEDRLTLRVSRPRLRHPVDYDGRGARRIIMEYHQKVSSGPSSFEEHLDATSLELQCGSPTVADAAVHGASLLMMIGRARPKTVARAPCGPCGNQRVVWLYLRGLHAIEPTRPRGQRRVDGAGSTRRTIDVHAGAGPWARARAGSRTGCRSATSYL